MINLHNVEQGSDEWFDLRIEKLTGSNATAIGSNGAGLKTYCKNIVLELIGNAKDNYTNSEMERGNVLEPIGRMAYEFETGLEVKEVGFITNSKYENVGISPDGLVGEYGGFEHKSRNDAKHLSLILGDENGIPKNQIQMCLLITERKWWDFVSFNPNLSKSLFIKRIYPDEKYFEKLILGFLTGNRLKKEYLETYKKYNHEN